MSLTKEMPEGTMYYMRTCSENGCDKPVRARGLCNTHYHLFRRHNLTGECMVHWCNNKEYAKGLCPGHYNRVHQMGLPIVDEMAPWPPCHLDFCDRPANSRTSGVCQTHYLQKYVGREQTPIRPRRSSPDQPGMRECLTCKELKLAEEWFYLKKNGTYQSECKPCIIKRNRRNYLLRVGRHEEAALLT